MQQDDDPEAPAPKRGRRSGAATDGEADQLREEADEEEVEFMEHMAQHYMMRALEVKASLGVTEQEAEQLTTSMVRFMLFRQAQRPHQPVRREELVRVSLGGYTQRVRNLGGIVIRLAQARLSEVFGLEMKEILLHPTSHIAKGKIKGSLEPTKAYVLRSMLPTALRALVCPEPEPLSALAMVIFSVIHLAGGSVSDTELWRNLEDLGMKRADGHHAQFRARSQEQLNSLVKQRYLAEVRKTQGADGERTYELGDSAKSEITDERVQEFIKQVFDATQQERAA